LAIDKQYEPATPIDGLVEMEPEEGLDIEIQNALTTETEDGGMIVDFDPSANEMQAESFDSNLVEYLDDDELNSVGNELLNAFNSDRDSRADWEETYTKGLDQLGLKIEDRTTPWAGACGVFHPMLSEAVIKFQSQAISEIFPASGPVRTKIVGPINSEKEKQSQRVQDYLNYLLTYEMTEYRTETEKMLVFITISRFSI